MDESKKNIMASLLIRSRLYEALPKRMRGLLLCKLSLSYPSFFCYKADENNEVLIVGYEAAWAVSGKKLG